MEKIVDFQDPVDSLKLCEQLVDHRAPRHEGEWPVQAVAQFQVRGNAEAAIDGGDDVGGKYWVEAREGADAVAGAVDESLPDSAARHEQAVAKVPVVAAAAAAVD